MKVWSGESGRYCFACNRYIGRAGNCPYCDLKANHSWRECLMKTGVWLLAAGGLLLLWLYNATPSNPPAVTDKTKTSRPLLQNPVAERERP